MGVRVKETNQDTRTAKTTVMPNWKKNLPMIPFMKATGRKMTMMASVVAETARPISEVAKDAASLRRHAVFDMAMDVLNDDNGIVDEDADGKGEGQHGHVVEGEIEDVHDGEGGHDGNRDGERADERDRQALQEDQNRQGGEEPSIYQVMLHFSDGAVDEVGLVEGDLQFHSGGKGGS